MKAQAVEGLYDKLDTKEGRKDITNYTEAVEGLYDKLDTKEGQKDITNYTELQMPDSEQQNLADKCVQSRV